MIGDTIDLHYCFAKYPFVKRMFLNWIDDHTKEFNELKPLVVMLRPHPMKNGMVSFTNFLDFKCYPLIVFKGVLGEFIMDNSIHVCTWFTTGMFNSLFYEQDKEDFCVAFKNFLKHVEEEYK